MKRLFLVFPPESGQLIILLSIIAVRVPPRKTTLVCSGNKKAERTNKLKTEVTQKLVIAGSHY